MTAPELQGITASLRRTLIVNPLMADLRTPLRQVPTLAVGVLQDGAPELWNLLDPALAAEPLVTTYEVAIDRYHLNARLGAVLRPVRATVVRA